MARRRKPPPYITTLEDTGDQTYMLILAELDGMDQVYRHAVIEDGECRLLTPW